MNETRDRTPFSSHDPTDKRAATSAPPLRSRPAKLRWPLVWVTYAIAGQTVYAVGFRRRNGKRLVQLVPALSQECGQVMTIPTAAILHQQVIPYPKELTPRFLTQG